jgi:hypothetical protein
MPACASAEAQDEHEIADLAFLLPATKTKAAPFEAAS